MLKLIGFKHMDPAYIQDNFCALAVNEGSLGLAFDLKRQAILEAIVPPEVIKQSVYSSTASSEADTELGEELKELALVLPMMFTVGLRSFYWCFQCKNASSTYECGCPERLGVTDVDWDGLDNHPTYVSPVHHYEIHIQSLKPITVLGYQGPLTVDQIIQNITERYKVIWADSRFVFLFKTLSEFPIPTPGEIVNFAYKQRTVGHIRCWR